MTPSHDPGSQRPSGLLDQIGVLDLPGVRRCQLARRSTYLFVTTSSPRCSSSLDEGGRIGSGSVRWRDGDAQVSGCFVDLNVSMDLSRSRFILTLQEQSHTLRGAPTSQTTLGMTTT